MKNLKIALMLVLALCMVFCFAACGEEEAAQSAPETTETPVVTTEAPTEAIVETEPQNPVYTVKVVDEDGNPIVGVLVQVCNVEAACFPGSTNEEGVATFSLEEAEYKVSFLQGVPEGYALVGETDVFYFEAGSRDLTITLQKQG